MPFDEADLDRLKDSLPDAYRAERAGGMLTNNFLTVSALRALTPLKGSHEKNIAEQTLFNLGMGFLNGSADVAAPNFILSGAAQTAREHVLENSSHEKTEREEIDTALAQSREQLRRMLADLDEELAAIDARLEEIRLRRIEIGNELGSAQDLEDLVAKGIDVSDPAYADLCRKAGIDPAQLRGKDKGDQLDVIAHRRSELTAEDDTLETEWNDKMARRGVILERKKDVNAALDDLDQANTDEAKLSAIRRAETVTGVRALSGAAFETDNAEKKLIAADTVAKSAESVDFGKRAATDTAAFIAASDDLDWDKPTASPASSQTMKP